jgi:mevalonate kinase
MCVSENYNSFYERMVIFMFNFFKKKAREEDPILKEINRQTEELKAITDSMRRDNESLEADIQIAEKILLNRGYSQEDLEKIKIKSKLKIVK